MTKENKIKSETLEKSANMLKAISHPVRLNIMNMLNNRKLTVTEIIDSLDIEQSVISHHLRIMRDRDVLSVTREGKNSYYYLKHVKLIEIVDCLVACCEK